MIRIKAVGDICPGDKSVLGFGVFSLSQKLGTDFFFNNIASDLSNADILIGNLEGALTANPNTSQNSKRVFLGDSNFVKSLNNCGFNLINCANNHIFDNGKQFFQETISLLSNYDMDICGLRDFSNNFYSKPIIKTIDNKKIGFLAYNWISTDKFSTVDNFISQSKNSAVNYTWDRSKNSSEIPFSRLNCTVISDIDKLKQHVDYLVLLPHWGYEFIHYPPNTLRKEAKSFIDCGADIIIGTHPHVLQGVEIYKNKPIFYSLGNFIFDSRFKTTKHSIILDITIVENIINYSITPIYINKYFQPCKATNRVSEKIFSIFYNSTKLINDNNVIALNDNNAYKQYVRCYKKNKFINILYHFFYLFRSPSMIFTISLKTVKFFKILILNAKGTKIRW